uniref:C2 domain-containing protein n=1 Tax=Lygus hesperus TaxID=30085 RepID=A0A0K8SQC8_LYGHE
MPPPPPGFGPTAAKSEAPTGPIQSPAPPPRVQEADPPAPATVMEALEQRLAKFQQQEESAKAEGNSSKARRMGRIVKQYQDAIKLHRAGKPFPVDELPTPPGFAPIPVSGVSSAVPVGPSLTLSPGKRLEPASPSSSSPATPQRSPLPSLKGVEGTKQEKQLKLLLQKQKQFKEAALKAKQDGNLQLAKEYLRQYKSFDPLIEAAQGGFPVDLTTLPATPGSSQVIEKEYEIVKMTDCLPGTTSEMYNQLITDLHQQLKLCMETRAHFKAIGDVANANKFEQLAVSSKKDLDTVKIACNKDEPIPKFHYERRTFDIVRCNTDLTDNEMEISILQGVNYNVPNPKEIDTYVRFEFPAPNNEEPKRDKTSTVYNTNNPAYDAKFMISIPRSNRNFQRLFRRHALKLEVWSKGGFLRSDSMVGTVNVKLLPLETKCTVHDSFDLMDGRKPLGGKLEVKIRIRHPIQSKQVEQLQEKWLVVD